MKRVGIRVLAVTMSLLGCVAMIRAASVVEGTGTGLVRAIGYVEPASELRLLRFEVDGVIAECLVKEGDTVEAGQPLMRLRNEVERAELALCEARVGLARAEEAQTNVGVNRRQIEAATKKAEASLRTAELARKDFERAERLVADGAISQAELDAQRTRLRTAEATYESDRAEVRHLESFVKSEDAAVARLEVEVAERELALAEARFDRTMLRSPIRGTVLRIVRREGESAERESTMPAIVLGDTEQLRVRAEVDERFVRSVHEGASASVTTREPGAKASSGKVRSIRGIMGKKTQFNYDAAERRDLDVVEVLIEMEAGFRAPVGMQVDVSLMTGQPGRGTE